MCHEYEFTLLCHRCVSMNDCKYCEYKALTYTDLRQHYIKQHKEQKPYQCNLCKKAYKHKASLTRHTCVSGIARMKGVSSTASKDSNHDTIEVWSLKSEQTNPVVRESGEAAFYDWCTRDLERPSQSSAESIWKLMQRETLLKDISTTDIEEFEATLFQFEDECLLRNVSIKTISNYVRQFHVFLQYKNEAIQAIDDDIFICVQLRISELTKAATRNMINHGTLALIDPYSAATLRNDIVNRLGQYQLEVLRPTILPWIRAREAPRQKKMIAFGISSLRPWLELAMRFTNIPCRMQVTQNLLLPSTQNSAYISKLALDGSVFTRIINRDKVKTSHQPIRIPLCVTLSAYLTMYIYYCRPESTSEFVFVTKLGSKWVKASADVKAFLKDQLKLDPNAFDSSGRFVHGSRHIVLSSYALSVNFNEEKLLNMATLMRHTLATSLKFYNVFSEIYRAKIAMQSFAEIMRLPTQNEEQCASSNFIQASLPRLSALIANAAHEVNCEHSLQHFKFHMKDACTQTDEIFESKHDADANQTINANNTIPICDTCKTKFTILGPVGSKRHHHFGKFFLKCLSCDPDKRISSQAIVYKLGVMPPGPSQSNRPRNYASIVQYIYDKTKSKVIF